MRAVLSLIAGLGLPIVTQAASNTSWPWQSYRSSAFEPPDLKVTKHGDTTPGFFFFDQNGPTGHNYSLFIMSEDNELVWQSPRGSYSAYKPQFLNGEPVLVFHNGIDFSEPYGFGYGIIEIYDSSYDNIYNVSVTSDDDTFTAIGGYDDSGVYSWIDMHESKITLENTILVTLYNVTQYDLSSIGGPKDGWVTDSLFYEIDVVTNEILYSWSALDHTDEIPLEDVQKFYPLEDYGRNRTLPYGYFHINSVDKFADGSYLISSRFYSSFFKIATDGSVEWTLQGDSGADFELGNDISFRYQHDARIRRETDDGVEISFFNNDNSGITYGINETTGIILWVDEKQRKATLVSELIDPNDTIYSASQGGLQPLPDGHHFMSYGSTPKMKEFGINGTLLMSMQFGNGDGTVFSYRGYKSPWVGLPSDPPSVYACVNDDGNTEVYMSWNGATEHKQWHIFSGEKEGALALSRNVTKSGFETSATLSGRVSFVQAEASNGSGYVSKRSEVTSPTEEC
ncbi:hypothetical protein GMORB2_1237 [Geosmithia morbida]|uniref:ASST-domain-containing protein n=1 Tax=Geosmithia morbida TaxID=1094350 RepID=A0A9P4YZL9_9HYPO|nr:uncharacterized protein GMORB2_1237 [Geosmithia morbida]KAF4125991.1 hypothetical protein GMORB2_1237 [Geosmithia morbida]